MPPVQSNEAVTPPDGRADLPGVSPTQDLFDRGGPFEITPLAIGPDAPMEEKEKPAAPAGNTPSDGTAVQPADAADVRQRQDVQPEAEAEVPKADPLEAFRMEMEQRLAAPTLELAKLREQNARLEQKLADQDAAAQRRQQESQVESIDREIATLRAARRNAEADGQRAISLELSEQIDDLRDRKQHAIVEARVKVPAAQPNPDAAQSYQRQAEVLLRTQVDTWRTALGVNDDEMRRVIDEDARLAKDPAWAARPGPMVWTEALRRVRKTTSNGRPTARASMVEGSGTAEPTRTSRVQLTEAERYVADAMGMSEADYLRHKQGTGKAMR